MLTDRLVNLVKFMLDNERNFIEHDHDGVIKAIFVELRKEINLIDSTQPNDEELCL